MIIFKILAVILLLVQITLLSIQMKTNDSSYTLPILVIGAVIILMSSIINSIN
jgi:uncharacterized membrane protein